MKKLLFVFLACSVPAFGSGTITPGIKAGIRCATSSVSGTVTSVNAEAGQLAFLTTKNETRNFTVSEGTLFRIPGATKEELASSPLSKVAPNSRAKVTFCSKDQQVVEVKVER